MLEGAVKIELIGKPLITRLKFDLFKLGLDYSFADHLAKAFQLVVHNCIDNSMVEIVYNICLCH
ncbi:hypothetical protein DXX93_03490 [Thalassotalea euphylliae]|uniref:Uncharacterized protein n=1 Tax=Thalassotalea euphylliae TaxID=1655234 RepID=A0A3E0TMF5_9GAMM|nr:hypothetical protein DXX93_03490 [Thalassotalea euphylliae]